MRLFRREPGSRRGWTAHRAVGRVLRVRGRRLVSVVAALTVLAGILVAVVVNLPAGSAGPPVQQSGTAAGRSHRASAALGQRLPQSASARAARAEAALREVHAPAGSVPPTSAPPKARLVVAGVKESAQALPGRAAPPVQGYSQRSSKVMAGQTAAGKVVYQNADGTRTAQFYSDPVNYRRPAEPRRRSRRRRRHQRWRR
jgi:hypothetical protein